jgi:NAD-dependent dihydropyrimidine dehydrogenase PreA subunit
VLDYDRCQNCKQCLNFCLFGVYALSEQGKVEVRKPSGCKTNCPACARMCPQKAIIFPKYADAPINGEEVPAMIADSEGGPPVLSKDIYDQIRQRTAGRKRFSRAGEAPSTARSCPTLDGLRRELGIPDDVLNSLSPAEFQRIAARKNAEQPQSDARADDGRKGKEHDE